MSVSALRYPADLPAPAWSTGSVWRLAGSMLLSALVLATALGVLPPLRMLVSEPVAELLVRIVSTTPPAVQIPPESLPRSESPAKSVNPAALPVRDESEPPEAVESVQLQVIAQDLSTAKQQAVEAFVERQEGPASPKPVLDEKRRRAAGQYRPPSRQAPREIWENTERDSMGRNILRHGDCYRVLDDPNVTRRYQYETFDQYMTTCAKSPGQARELPWVAELRERYDYLENTGDFTVRDESRESER